MPTLQVHPGRLSVLALAAVAVLAALLLLAAGAPRASAFPADQHGGAVCSNCHTGSLSNATCTACHTGYAAPQASYTCWSCHKPGQDVQVVKTGAPTSCTDTCHLANGSTHAHDPHPARGGCTAAGCHNVTTDATTANGSPHHVAKTVTPATTTLTARVAPATVALGKKVKVTGAAAPVAALAGAKIAVKLERKVGTRWVRMRAPATATVSASGAYVWSCKTVKKGAHKVTLTIKATATYTKKTLSRTFKVR